MGDATKSRKSVFIDAGGGAAAGDAGTEDAGKSPRKSMGAGRKSIKLSISRKSAAGNRYSTAGHLIPNSKAGERTLQATYRLESQRPLNAEVMYNICKQTVDTAIASSALDRYNPKRANRFCQSLAREIQKRIVCEDFERFRVIVVVTMMEKANQSGQSQLGFLWDAEQDQWTDYHYEARDFVVNALVLGVYYE